MPLAPAIGASLSAGLAAPPRSLFVGGLDVLKRPGMAGNDYGTPIETITVREAGPGGVSSMEFVIDDPKLELAFDDAAEVVYVNHALSRPDFRGFVQSIEPTPAFGDQGRRLHVVAQGVEAVLDWAKTTVDLTWTGPNSVAIADGIQSIVANSVGLGPIRAFYNLATFFGNQAFPIEPLNGASNVGTITIPAGTTVREAIRILWSAPAVISDGWLGMLVTVDFTWGLRAWEAGSVGASPIAPDDYAGGGANPAETIVDTQASSNRATELGYAKNPGGTVRGVVVTWSAGVVAIGDGSGKLGAVGSIVDVTLTSAALASAAGQAYMASMRTTDRGSYRQTDRAASDLVRVGARVDITDARLGLTGGIGSRFHVQQIDKTYNAAGRENWRVSFGGLAPSAAVLIRRLTRDTIS